MLEKSYAHCSHYNNDGIEHSTEITVEQAKTLLLSQDEIIHRYPNHTITEIKRKKDNKIFVCFSRSSSVKMDTLQPISYWVTEEGEEMELSEIKSSEFDFIEVIVYYVGTVYKHHLAEHFKKGLIPIKSGAGKGGTIFLDFKSMENYLNREGGEWWVAELQLEGDPIIFEYDYPYMATILVDKPSVAGFKPLQRYKRHNDLKLMALKYKRQLEFKKGHNYEYWGEKHENLLLKGYEIFNFSNKLITSTRSEDAAKDKVEYLRKEGNYARIVCGYDKSIQREKFYTVLFKRKK